jgi:RNA-directed DNA polymerase
VSEGGTVVVDMDLEKFFDRVNHDILMSRVATRS